jgi:hypothetical protein
LPCRRRIFLAELGYDYSKGLGPAAEPVAAPDDADGVLVR